MDPRSQQRPEVSDPIVHFVRRVLARQAMVGLTAFIVAGIFAPRLLMLEGDLAGAVLTVGATLATLALVANAALTLVSLRRHRPLLDALAAGERDLEPFAIGRLADLSGLLSARFFTLSTACAALVVVPGVRPDRLDDGRAVSLFVLTLTLLGGASLPHYVLTRQAVLEVIELAPLEPLSALLEGLEVQELPWSRITRRLLLAVVAPVALLGAGGVLVTHAHQRTFVEQSTRQTAVHVARAALELSPAPAGRSAAAQAAADLGFHVRFEPQAAPDREPEFSRLPDGQLLVTAPLDEGQAVLRFDAELDPATVSGGVAVGLLAVLLAGALGASFGRVLADDLVHATRRIRLLGTESVLRGQAQIARPARFALVAELGRAIEDLTARFRVFAAAQEKALDARAAAQRMRGLLFASVSHDLKSPLNAILGFAELVSQGDLTNAQRESLELIRRRGRELLGLIETILDAARVEAAQLELSTRPVTVSRLILESVRKARELAGDEYAPVDIEVVGGLAPIPADPAYATRALAVIIAQGIRTTAADPNAPMTRVRGSLPPDPGDQVCIEIELGSREVTRDELEMLFARQATGRGRGLTLGLSLARSVIELHGGAVEVEGRREGGAVCRVWMPMVAPRARPRLTSFPTLG
jgi:signal transduction histidine kinase